jgi:APA family basic amino acid/polyamine antiporter
MEPCRQMGLAAVVAAVTGESVAFGNFLTPAAMAKSLGPPLLVVAVWCGMACACKTAPCC